MTPTEARAEIVERLSDCRRYAESWTRRAELVEAELAGWDARDALQAPRAVRRDLRERVLATLSDMPQTITGIQKVTQGRHRDIERILIRSPLQAKKIDAGWIWMPVETFLQQAAE